MKNALQRQEGESDFKQEMSVMDEYQSKANLQMESRWSWVYTVLIETQAAVGIKLNKK